MIACLGDSITVGRPGESYLKYIDSPRDYHNHGCSGETLWGLSRRIDSFISQSYDDFIIEIGVNDILLPYLKDHSLAWNHKVQKLILRGSIPLEEVHDFKREYEKLIWKLEDKNVKIISIPCIGEVLNSDLNQKVDEYNDSIQELCEKYHLRYIDFNKWQKMALGLSEFRSPYFISTSIYGLMFDSVLTTRLGLSDFISKIRRLVVTVDGVHLNKNGAQNLARLIQKTE